MINHFVASVIIYVLMAGILIALGSGLYFILFKRENPERAAKSLTIRVSLSLILFLVLVIGFATGLLAPHGI